MKKKTKNTIKFHKFAFTLLCVGFFFVHSLSARADTASCYCYDNNGPVPARTTILSVLLPSTDTATDCNQLCANTQMAHFYAFHDNGTVTAITLSPGAAVATAPSHTCSCDNGGVNGGVVLYPTTLITRNVNSQDECKFLCTNQAGATRMRYDELTPADTGWLSVIPVAIPNTTPAAPAAPIPTQFNYTLLESFPGFFAAGTAMNTNSSNDLPALILAIYKFGIWTVGIAGLFMMVIGGIMYMGSAGNTSTASSAQGIITDALIGITAALGAYLVLWVINPDLTKINLNNFVAVGVSDFGGPTGTGNPNPESPGCTTDAMLAKIKSASQGKDDPCLTFAMLNVESGCNPNAESHSVPIHACGISQMLPSTAGISCDALKSDVDGAISRGLSYFLSNSKFIRGNLNGTGNARSQAIEDIYAGYNGGAGALAASVSCAGQTNNFGYPYKAWDCTIDPGKLIETQSAAPKFLSSFMACDNDANLQAKLK